MVTDQHMHVRLIYDFEQQFYAADAPVDNITENIEFVTVGKRDAVKHLMETIIFAMNVGCHINQTETLFSNLSGFLITVIAIVSGAIELPVSKAPTD